MTRLIVQYCRPNIFFDEKMKDDKLYAKNFVPKNLFGAQYFIFQDFLLNFTMPSMTPGISLKGYQDFVREVYGIPNDRHFSLWDMMSNIERFTMRGLKGIRKGDADKTKLNLLISLSWFMSMMNRLHIDLEHDVWNRFPYLCSYCASCPCGCKETKPESRMKIYIDSQEKPGTLTGFQAMFNTIYPSASRTVEHAGVHLAEELGELSEAILGYTGGHHDDDFKGIGEEAADFFSCMMGVFNSLDIDVAAELSAMFQENCHVCKKAPCECSFSSIVRFRS